METVNGSYTRNVKEEEKEEREKKTVAREKANRIFHSYICVYCVEKAVLDFKFNEKQN